MNILAFDTSSTSGSIAVCKDDRLSYLSYLDLKVTHSERLLPQIDIGLKQSRMDINDIDLITISNGPGSFTGIRIGLSTAKGLCFAAEIPLLPVNTLEALAYNLIGNKYPVLTFLDAKMDEVYAALYSPQIKFLIPPQNSKPAAFLTKITEKVTIVGDGARKYFSEIKASGIEYQLALPHQNLVLASTLIGISLISENLPEYDFESISKLEPFYLRKSQAELIKNKKAEGK